MIKAVTLLFAGAGACFTLAIMQFFKIGYPITFKYMDATKRERESMDLTKMFRQASLYFLLIGLLCLMFGLNELYHKTIFMTLGWAAAWGALIMPFLTRRMDSDGK